MIRFLKKQPAVRFIAFGFLFIILIGSIILKLPISIKKGMNVSYIDCLYTSTSAVCVTGLIAVDTADHFTLFGQIVVAFLIQIGGLGVTAIGAGIILAISHKVNLKEISVIKEGLNLHSGKSIVNFIKDIFYTTIIIESIGALVNFIVFINDYNWKHAIWLSIFHSIAAFNNSGFDILGGGVNLIPYQNNILLNLTTSALIILGGIGFLVIREIREKRFKWKRYSMHTRVVISMTVILLMIGTVLIKFSQKDITWLGAFFFSVSARTAGFSTFVVGRFSEATLLVIIVLMFIGASPGSTGGGIKTTTFFVLLQGIKGSATNRQEKAFHYSIPKESFKKASVITILGLSLIIVSTYLIVLFEPNLRFIDALFEMTSAFGTVGLSTGITPDLGIDSKLLSIVMMYIGRLGPLTIVSLWNFNKIQRFYYPEGNISIG